jgi:uncharacterized membrane protein
MLELANGAGVTPETARFFAAPIPVVLHILSASLFSSLGAAQFSASLRLRHPAWHGVCGRIAVASGAMTAITGFWMTLIYDIPAELQGDLLFNVRILVSLAMLISIVTSVIAVVHGDIATHRAWMIRAYALGQGAGMQVAVLLPWMLLQGKPSVWQRDVLMSTAWVVNLLIAEWIIRRQHPRQTLFNKVFS